MWKFTTELLRQHPEALAGKEWVVHDLFSSSPKYLSPPSSLSLRTRAFKRTKKSQIQFSILGILVQKNYFLFLNKIGTRSARRSSGLHCPSRISTVCTMMQLFQSVVYNWGTSWCEEPLSHQFKVQGCIIPCSTLLFWDRWRLACLWTRISETAVGFVEADLFVQTSYIDLKGEV